MKFILVLAMLLPVTSFSQKIDSVNIPPGVVYKYASAPEIEKATMLVANEIAGSPLYSLDNGAVFVGPVLWSRFSKIPSLAAIPGGNVTINYDNQKLSAKMIQNKEGFKLIWDQVRSEIGQKNFVLRKASYKELQYYWSVISFDIEEPLIVIETSDHRYILNLSPKDLKLLWLDEAPDSTK